MVAIGKAIHFLVAAIRWVYDTFVLATINVSNYINLSIFRFAKLSVGITRDIKQIANCFETLTCKGYYCFSWKVLQHTIHSGESNNPHSRIFFIKHTLTLLQEAILLNRLKKKINSKGYVIASYFNVSFFLILF